MTRQERINVHKKQDRIDSVKQSFKDDTSIVVSPLSVLQDSTGGTVSNILNDTTSSVKDDVASLAGKVNEILIVHLLYILMKTGKMIQSY